MTQLKWWLRLVGGFLLFLALLSLPPIQTNAFVSVFSNPLGEPIVPMFGLLSDTGIMFGLELGMIGLMLIVAAGAPWQALNLAYPILVLEVIRDILDDVSTIGHDHTARFYSVFIRIHLLILVMGLAFLKQRLGPSEFKGTV